MENSSFKPSMMRGSIVKLEKKLMGFKKISQELKEKSRRKKSFLSTLFHWIVK